MYSGLYTFLKYKSEIIQNKNHGSIVSIGFSNGLRWTLRQSPFAQFECNSSSHYLNESVSFRFTGHESYWGSTFLWDFGDNTSSSESNPTHKYDLPGDYRVTLNVENKYGSSSSEMNISIINTGYSQNTSNIITNITETSQQNANSFSLLVVIIMLYYRKIKPKKIISLCKF